MMDYKKAGVDIDAGNKLIELIKPLVATTYNAGAIGDIGGFGGLYDIKKIANYKHPILVSATDGVGTKLKLAIQLGIYDTIGIDLVAMCVNDIIVCGARPLFFLDYFATSRLELAKATEIIQGITTGCKMAGAALIGGETAEMPGLYKKDDFDLAGFSLGVVEKNKIIKKENVKKNDDIVGIRSSGVHANGFSLIRAIIDNNKINTSDKINNKTIGEILLTPTKIYVKPVLNILKKYKIKATAHITGGGITENIPRVIPNDLKINIHKNSWDVPQIFDILQDAGGISDKQMQRVFNLGVGFVLICSPRDSDKIMEDLKNMNEEAFIIGNIG
jgi:phosphoribosylformylglycinamidine cyclo-ligase